VKYAQLGHYRYTNETDALFGIISWLDVHGVEDSTLRLSLPALLDLHLLHKLSSCNLHMIPIKIML